MIRTTPFTSHSEFTGVAPYAAFPALNPNAPSVRSVALPPVVAPAPGPWALRKTGTPPGADPSNFAPPQALVTGSTAIALVR